MSTKSALSSEHNISSSTFSPLLSPKVIHNPHDKLFKRALANIEVVKDFFDIHLSDDMKANKETMQTVAQYLEQRGMQQGMT